MTKSELIERARKVASMLKSPYEHEVLTAASLLKKMLDEHNLSYQDIGLKEAPHVYTRKASSDSNVPSSPVYTSQSVGFAKVSEIVEINYKHGTSSLSKWCFDFFSGLARLYNVDIIYYRDHSKIVGYDHDIEIFKSILVYVKSFLESQISSRGYTSEHEIFGYVSGFYSRLEESIRSEITPEAAELSAVKKSKIAEYLTRYKYNTKIVAPTSFSRDAYAVGRADADPKLAIGSR